MRALCSLLAIFLVADIHAQELNTLTDAKAIVSLELELCDLLARGSFDEYAGHLTSDYALTTGQGEVLSRQEALAWWRARGPGDKMTPSEMRVSVYGNTAILRARVAGPDGVDRITKTFVRIKGKWLLAALHVSPITEAHQ
jgi:hypothetical protein